MQLTAEQEKEFLESIAKIKKLLVRKYTFPGYTVEDISQQIYVFALEAMEKFETGRPMVGFLYKAVKTRLINFKRDFFVRNDPPCMKCHATYDKGGTPPHRAKRFCPKYLRWRSRNDARYKLHTAKQVDEDQHPSNESSTINFLAHRETIQILSENLSIEHRKLLLKALAGERLSPENRMILTEAVKKVLAL